MARTRNQNLRLTTVERMASVIVFILTGGATVNKELRKPMKRRILCNKRKMQGSECGLHQG